METFFFSYFCFRERKWKNKSKQCDQQSFFIIRKEREKTGVEFFVPLHPIAEKILSLYNTTDDIPFMLVDYEIDCRTQPA